ncbi:hypothetical protein CMK12_09955 [Candidatus Poribacteria bacterium]|nr:hypothetical protein [Candidatus Poribacteria bacterium]
MGSDDSVKVWINSYLVHQYNQGQGVEVDQDRFMVKLNSGKNRCLIKVSQGMGDWGFVIRPEVRPTLIKTNRLTRRKLHALPWLQKTNGPESKA